MNFLCIFSFNIIYIQPNFIYFQSHLIFLQSLLYTKYNLFAFSHHLFVSSHFIYIQATYVYLDTLFIFAPPILLVISLIWYTFSLIFFIFSLILFVFSLILFIFSLILFLCSLILFLFLICHHIILAHFGGKEIISGVNQNILVDYCYERNQWACQTWYLVIIQRRKIPSFDSLFSIYLFLVLTWNKTFFQKIIFFYFSAETDQKKFWRSFEVYNLVCLVYLYILHELTVKEFRIWCWQLQKFFQDFEFLRNISEAFRQRSASFFYFQW